LIEVVIREVPEKILRAVGFRIRVVVVLYEDEKTWKPPVWAYGEVKGRRGEQSATYAVDGG
jgi:hypothetical protein